MYNFQKFGEYIRANRETLKLTRAKLAEYCNISDKCLGNIELGLSDPKTSTLISICSELDVNLNNLKNFYQKEGSDIDEI